MKIYYHFKFGILCEPEAVLNKKWNNARLYASIKCHCTLDAESSFLFSGFSDQTGGMTNNIVPRIDATQL
jgi:hypothetical protein